MLRSNTLIAEAVDLVIFVDEEPDAQSRAQSQGGVARNRISEWPISGRACLKAINLEVIS